MPIGGFVRRSGYLRKWLILGVVIGIIAGLGAVTFYLALDYAGKFLLGFLGGYDVPTPVGDGGRRASPGFDGLFGSVTPGYVFNSAHVGWFALIGVVAAGVGYAFSVVPGAMTTVGIAYLLTTRTNASIYKSQRLNRESAT